MKVFKINPKKPDKKIIEKAAEVLKIGGLVVYPTETVYGLGANILDINAVQKVFEVKGRNLSKPISIAFKNLEQAKRFAYFAPLAEKISKKFLPGPLTLVLPARTEFGEYFGTDGKIRVRIPDNIVAQKILEKTKFPITSTSANLSGGKNPVTAKDAIEQIGDKVDVVLDAGKCKYGKPSTVVGVTDKIEIFREGVISKEEIFKLIK